MNTFDIFSISPNVREGLLDVFYGVYEKDPNKVNFFHECTKPCFVNICRRWLMNSSSFLCHLLFVTLKAKSFVQVLQAMIQMGVLVPTGDMTAVRRTAQFFLNRCFLSSKITSGFLFIF